MARKKKVKISPLTIKTIAIVLISAVLAAGIFWGLYYFVSKSDYFRVKTVFVDPTLSFINIKDFSGLKGKNIFKVDIKDVQKRLGWKYPQVSHLKVMRQFPDRIFVSAKKRDPTAQLLQKSKYLILDEQGIVLAKEDKKSKTVPLILGSRYQDQLASLGRHFKGEDIKTALKIVKEFGDHNDLSSYSIESINIGNLSKIEFALGNKLNVIVDKDSIERKIKILGLVLVKGQIDLKETKYVDLRFKQPIIGKK